MSKNKFRRLKFSEGATLFPEKEKGFFEKFFDFFSLTSGKKTKKRRTYV